ncbi:hypothetical protein HXX76_005469 [Chlamydomonas incerta]|uniref:Uncharacterized protein n=1 Tax=Chlamydomonas incerta TaxID=51695 RepID=A0A835T5M1_CHLIN|nr:hypothetical protein HXX76_005469 [Chlamydomonas incerta]|eukprot:KAG2437851.1 hypothetical protein HXX76_005469 [Chlamydomonas incerta]
MGAGASQQHPPADRHPSQRPAPAAGGPAAEPADWSVIFYWATDHVETANIETGAWRDLAKLTGVDRGVKGPTRRGAVTVDILMDLYSTGAYRVSFDGDPRKDGFLCRRIEEPDMTSAALLARYLAEVVAARPARHRMIVFGGHGCAWLSLAEEGHVISIKDMAAAVKAAGGCDVVALDACLMGCLECACEFSGVAKYVTACENYCPWNGIVTPKLLPALWANASPAELAKGLVAGFMAANVPPDLQKQLAEGKPLDKNDESLGKYRTDDPTVVVGDSACDIMALDVEGCMRLYKWLQERPHIKPVFDTDAAVDSSWPVLFDLTTVVRRGLAALGDPAEEVKAFEEASAKAYVARGASPNTPDTLKGLSVVRWPLGPDVQPWLDGGHDINLTYPTSVTYPAPFAAS